jgi:hypothetical protein
MHGALVFYGFVIHYFAVDGLAFNGFTADSAREHATFEAHGVRAFCDAAVFFSFTAPY